jgi:hypothetical protein
MVCAPSPEEEDRRRLTGERGTLLKQRIQHTNRTKGLLSDRFERLRGCEKATGERIARVRKTCCRRSGGVGLRALAVRAAVGMRFVPGARLAASLGTAA